LINWRESDRRRECIRSLLNVRPNMCSYTRTSLPNRHIIPPDNPISPDRVIYPASESICSDQRDQMEKVDGGCACRVDARLVRHGMSDLRCQEGAVGANAVRPDRVAQNWQFPRNCRLRQARLKQTTQILALTLARSAHYQVNRSRRIMTPSLARFAPPVLSRSGAPLLPQLLSWTLYTTRWRNEAE
jgi:hypothetical protein